MIIYVVSGCFYWLKKEVKIYSGNCNLKFFLFDIFIDLFLKSVVVVMRNYFILFLVFFFYYFCLDVLGFDEDLYKILGVICFVS